MNTQTQPGAPDLRDREIPTIPRVAARLTLASLTELTVVRQPPCLSLYQPTHRHNPGNQQDTILYENLIKKLRISLEKKFSHSESELLLQPFENLVHDREFWRYTSDALAVFCAPGFFRVFQVQRPLTALAIVADSFHIKPLRQFLQSVGRFQVLGLSLEKVQLFEGDRNSLHEIPLAADVPVTLEMTEVNGGIAVHRGHAGPKDEVKVDMERFCRAVDRAVLAHHSRPTGLPLILAALPQHHHIFRQTSHNPFLLADGLTSNPESLTIDELRERAWKIVEPEYDLRLLALTDGFNAARPKGLAGDDVKEIAQAAASGRVATLLIEADREIAGRLDGSSGLIEFADLSDPQVDDLLDDLGELVGKMGGRVFVLSAEQMPVKTGLAAVYRY